MSTKSFFWLILFAALSFQCSKTTDETDEISFPPAKPSVENPDSTPEPTPGKGNQGPAFSATGFADASNARLIVNSLNARVDPENQYVVAWLEGNNDNGACCYDGSKISELFLHEDGTVYASLLRNDRFSILNLPYGGDWTYIFQWNLEYLLVEHAALPDEMVISGTGLGSYFYGDAANNSLGIRFEFTGTQIEGTKDFEGPFTLEEKSRDEKYSLFLTGTLTLERD